MHQGITAQLDGCRKRLERLEAGLAQLKTMNERDTKMLEDCREEKEKLKIDIAVLEEKEKSTAKEILKYEIKIETLQSQPTSRPSTMYSGK